MKTILPLVLTTFTALLFAGCESTGVTARIQEKRAVYATLAQEQQQMIQSGGLDVGYSPDMVYLAFGKPSRIETKNGADGPVTVWTYTRFYPTEAVAKAWSASTLMPSTFQVLFYEDKVFDAALEQELRPMRDALITNDMAESRFERTHTPGMYAAGILPRNPPPATRPQ